MSKCVMILVNQLLIQYYEAQILISAAMIKPVSCIINIDIVCIINF